MYTYSSAYISYRFETLAKLMACASPLRSGDMLAGVAASCETERAAAQHCLADVPLKTFLTEELIPYDRDEVTRIIMDSRDTAAFSEHESMTVGEFREWLLDEETDGETLKKAAPGITPEMAAAVSKIMKNQDLILAASKIRNVTAFRNTLGLPGRLSTRLQPNHPTDDLRGIAASVIDGLLYGSGDAVIGINPAGDNIDDITNMLKMLDEIICSNTIPTQSCVLTHVTTTLDLINRGIPVDLVFQSIGGTEKLNNSFGVNASILKEAKDAADSLKRGTAGANLMYFETGQGAALSADAAHGIDQQTLEARAYGLARVFDPLLVNTVVGFIGPEYLYDGKQIIRAGLEDHFCGKLLGLPMGMDICYTNHAEADQNDMDVLMTLMGNAGCNFIMGIPGGDDIMLNYQTTSYHDALYLRRLLGVKPAPEFESWLLEKGIFSPGLLPSGDLQLQLGEIRKGFQL